MIKTYIINLEESTDRRLFMEAQLKCFPELDFEFFDAIDARKISLNKLEEYYDRTKSLNNLGRSMVPGEIGVALSQIRVIEKLESSYDYGLIMEDDILISPYFSGSLKNAIQFIKHETPRIVLFTPVPEYSARNKIIIDENQNRFLYRVWKDACFAACYLINRSACKIMLERYSKIDTVIDNWGFFIENGLIDIRSVVPHVVAFSKYGVDQSTINLDGKRDSLIGSNFEKAPLFKRIKNRGSEYFRNRLYRVHKSPCVWFDSNDIINSSF